MAQYGQVQAFVSEALCFINEAPARPRLRESDDDDDKTKNEEKGSKGEEEVVRRRRWKGDEWRRYQIKSPDGNCSI